MPITKEELAKHNSEDDCYVSIHGKVYNVTKYMKFHPGSKEILLDLGGTECSDKFDEVNHSEKAHKIMQKYYVDDLSK